VIISDEIYAEVCHDGSAPSAIGCLPERTVVTSGLSKSMALGGWRIGLARVPDNEWGRELMSALTGVASEIWSSLAAPMQSAAAYVLSDPEPVTAHIAKARTLHARVAAAVHDAFIESGATCRRPTAGFYLYPDFGPVRDRLQDKGITTGDALADWLLAHHSVECSRVRPSVTMTADCGPGWRPACCTAIRTSSAGRPLTPMTLWRCRGSGHR